MKKILTILVLAVAGIGHLSVNNPDAEKFKEEWTLVSNHTTATVYNAVRSQCDSEPTYTASMMRIDPDNVSGLRVLAMERTMMKELGIRFGDIVRIEGTDTYDGIWQVQDTMNRRFAGQHRIDFLVPKEIKTGKWNKLSVYVPANDYTRIVNENKIKQYAKNNNPT